MKRLAIAIACGAIVLPPAMAAAPPTSAASFDAMLACRSIADSQQRLACYDSKATVLQDAQTKRDIVVFDREQMHQARRSLFGFSLPALNLFGDRGGKDARGPDDDVREVTELVKSAHPDGMGDWVVVLASGAIWHQTDGMLALAPRPGTNVTIRSGALGSYIMRVGSQPGVKVRRES